MQLIAFIVESAVIVRMPLPWRDVTVAPAATFGPLMAIASGIAQIKAVAMP